MSEEEFVLAATIVAEEHPEDELAIAFLEAFEDPDGDHVKCFNLAGKLMVKHAA